MSATATTQSQITITEWCRSNETPMNRPLVRAVTWKFTEDSRRPERIQVQDLSDPVADHIGTLEAH